MYYPERRRNARMVHVQLKLEQVVTEAFKDGRNPQARLEDW